MQPLGRAEIFVVAWLGTAIAGGLYPTVQLMINQKFPPLPNGIVDLIFFSVVAFVFGFVYAGLVGTFMVASCALLAAWIKIERAQIWIGSLAGGWTGFFCALPLRTKFSRNPWLDVLLATFMGQAGAAWIAQAALRRNRRRLGASAPPRERLQVGLRQLFAATTALCVLARLIGSMQPSREVYQLMAAAVAMQTLMILVTLGSRQFASLSLSGGKASAQAVDA